MKAKHTVYYSMALLALTQAQAALAESKPDAPKPEAHKAEPAKAETSKTDASKPAKPNPAEVAIPTEPKAAAPTTEGFRKEKCFGIARAGMNDCAATDGSHACAGYSKKDSTPHDWVLLPAGVCQKIVGGEGKPKGNI